MDTTDILIVVLSVVGLAIAVLLAINIRNGLKLETKMSQTVTDQTAAGQIAVLTERVQTLTKDNSNLLQLVTTLQARVATLETERIKQLETYIHALQDEMAAIKARIGPEQAAQVAAKVPAATLPLPPTPEAPTEGAKT